MKTLSIEEEVFLHEKKKNYAEEMFDLLHIWLTRLNYSDPYLDEKAVKSLIDKIESE